MDGFTQGLYGILETILSVLPDSPFSFIANYSNSPIGQWLGWLNWFIPVNTFLVILETWLSGILIYYVIQIVLRWVKAIE